MSAPIYAAAADLSVSDMKKKLTELRVRHDFVEDKQDLINLYKSTIRGDVSSATAAPRSVDLGSARRKREATGADYKSSKPLLPEGSWQMFGLIALVAIYFFGGGSGGGGSGGGGAGETVAFDVADRAYLDGKVLEIYT